MGYREPEFRTVRQVKSDEWLAIVAAALIVVAMAVEVATGLTPIDREMGRDILLYCLIGCVFAAGVYSAFAGASPWTVWPILTVATFLLLATLLGQQLQPDQKRVVLAILPSVVPAAALLLGAAIAIFKRRLRWALASLVGMTIWSASQWITYPFPWR